MASGLSAGHKARLRGEIPGQLKGFVIATSEQMGPGQMFMAGVHRMVVTRTLSREEFVAEVQVNVQHPDGASYSADLSNSKVDIDAARIASIPDHEPGMHYYAADPLGSAHHAYPETSELPEKRQQKGGNLR